MQDYRGLLPKSLLGDELSASFSRKNEDHRKAYQLTYDLISSILKAIEFATSHKDKFNPETEEINQPFYKEIVGTLFQIQ